MASVVCVYEANSKVVSKAKEAMHSPKPVDAMRELEESGCREGEKTWGSGRLELRGLGLLEPAKSAWALCRGCPPRGAKPLSGSGCAAQPAERAEEPRNRGMRRAPARTAVPFDLEAGKHWFEHRAVFSLEI
jgi:hypothetical protein